MTHKPTERVLHILLLLAAHPDGLTLTQITELLDIPKSTISPILQEMVQQKFLQLQEGTKCYSIGITSYCIGAAYEHEKTLIPYIKSIMKNIAGEINEICQVGVLDGADVLYILKEDASITQTIKIISYIGKKLPAYCTALGKALLCEYTLPQLQELYPTPLAKQTSYTITDLNLLYEQLQTIQQTHIAYEQEEITYQLCCLATPITLAHSPKYAMSISMPLFRATKEKRELAARLLLQAKESIEAYSHSIHLPSDMSSSANSQL